MEFIQVLLIQIICACIIFMYGKFRCDNPNYHDILLFKLGIWDLDGWSLCHFLFFGALGYFFPDQFLITITGGIFWELFEYYYAYFKPTFLYGFGHRKNENDIHNKKFKDLWWYGKFSDFIINYLGFIFGKYIKTGKIFIY